MKRLILAAMTVAALTVASRAEAALTYSMTICQSTNCLSFPNTQVISGVFWDYTIQSAIGGASNATPVSTSTTLNLTITRTGQTDPAPLDVWFVVSDYTLPTGPTYNFDVGFGTSQTTIDANSSRGLVTYQAWYSSTNSTTIPPTGSPSNLAGCTPAMGVLTNSCGDDPNPLVVGPGSLLFSIITLTQFNIAQGDTSQYGSLGQTSLSANPVVPEPGSMVLLGSGLLGMAAMLRRRSARK